MPSSQTPAVHTPGPWYDGEAEAVLPDGLNPEWTGICDTLDDGGVVAYCHPCNAPLISSAPFLLAEVTRLKALNGELVNALEWVIDNVDDGDLKATVRFSMDRAGGRLQ